MDLFIQIAAAIFAFIAMVGLAVLVNDKRLIFWLAIVSVYIPVGYIVRYFKILPTAFKWLPLGILIVCFFAFLIRQVSTQKMALIPKRIIFFYITIIFFGIISIAYNEVAVLPSFFSSIGLISFLIFSVVFNNKEYRLSQQKLFSVIIQIGIFETIVAVFERVVFVWGLQKGSSDMVAGTFTVDGQYTFPAFLHHHCAGVLVS